MCAGKLQSVCKCITTCAYSLACFGGDRREHCDVAAAFAAVAGEAKCRLRLPWRRLCCFCRYCCVCTTPHYSRPYSWHEPFESASIDGLLSFFLSFYLSVCLSVSLSKNHPSSLFVHNRTDKRILSSSVCKHTDTQTYSRLQSLTLLHTHTLTRSLTHTQIHIQYYYKVILINIYLYINHKHLYIYIDRHTQIYNL